MFAKYVVHYPSLNVSTSIDVQIFAERKISPSFKFFAIFVTEIKRVHFSRSIGSSSSVRNVIHNQGRESFAAFGCSKTRNLCLSICRDITGEVKYEVSEKSITFKIAEQITLTEETDSIQSTNSNCTNFMLEYE
jgi:hypothetical protein